jgi:hypothetical protein
MTVANTVANYNTALVAVVKSFVLFLNSQKFLKRKVTHIPMQAYY